MAKKKAEINEELIVNGSNLLTEDKQPNTDNVFINEDGGAHDAVLITEEKKNEVVETVEAEIETVETVAPEAVETAEAEVIEPEVETVENETVETVVEAPVKDYGNVFHSNRFAS
jgi:hypothetical protein